jgi:hypothetical protein
MIGKLNRLPPLLAAPLALELAKEDPLAREIKRIKLRKKLGVEQILDGLGPDWIGGSEHGGCRLLDLLRR